MRAKKMSKLSELRAEQNKRHEKQLDLAWAYLVHDCAGWRRFFPLYAGMPVKELARDMRISGTTARKLLTELVFEGTVIVEYTHQHRTYWEGLYRPAKLPEPCQPEQQDGGDIPF